MYKAYNIQVNNIATHLQHHCILSESYISAQIAHCACSDLRMNSHLVYLIHYYYCNMYRYCVYHTNAMLIFV